MDMDCREFRENHTLFVDQMCSAVAEAEMRAHMLFEHALVILGSTSALARQMLLLETLDQLGYCRRSCTALERAIH